MRSFWTALIFLSLLAITVFLFFVFSVSVRDRITFTDDQLNEPTVTVADPQIGAKEPSVTIVNFGDYQCPSCANLDQALSELITEYPRDLRVVWKDMPNTSVHDESLNAAIAAQCAGEQNAFWEYHVLLMQNSVQLGPSIYLSIADELELRTNAFSRCYDNQSTLPLVQRGFDEGVALDIVATPTIFINGTRYTGTMTQAELRNAIENELNGL